MSSTTSVRTRALALTLTLAGAVAVASGPASASDAVPVDQAADRVHDSRSATDADRPAPASRTLPPGSIRHQNSRYWVWFGPRNWLSVDNPNGILITSATNVLRLDEGFSSIFCANGATVAESVNNHFAQQRRSIFEGFRQTWGSVRMTASEIRRLPAAAWGPLYFRQFLQASGVEGGVPYRSVVRVDYSLASGPQNCLSRIVGMTAPARGFAQSLAVLRSVQASKSYFPPGVP
jgi:hypothetical protein